MSEYSYSILPYLYTQFFTAHVTGQPVARALFFEFPADDNCLELDAQYLLGPSLLITPVLTQGATSVQGYFPPAAQWYDFYTGAPVASGVQTLGKCRCACTNRMGAITTLC